MLVGSVIGIVIGIVITTIVSALIIWVIGELGVGIEVSGFGAAFVTAFFVAVLWAFATLLWNLIGYTPAGGLSGAITHLILTAGFLYGVRNAVSGLEVKGFGGAVIAAAAIALLSWLLNLAVGGLVPA